MKDPARLVEGSDGLGRQLLLAAREERPNSASLQRALVAASAAAAATTVGTGAAATGSAVAMWLKWLGIGAAGGLLTMGVVSAVVPAGRSPASVAPPRAAVAAPTATRAPSGRSADTKADTVATDKTTPRVSAAAENEARQPRAAASSRASAAPPIASADGLGAELASLDAARSRLRGGDAAGALVQLDAHARRFPKPRLGQEAALVRIEALAALGRCAEARRIGDAFLSANAGSVLAQRVRSIMGRCGG